MRIVLLLLVALIVAGGTGYYAFTKLRPPAAPVVQAEAVEAPKLPEVIVASVDLPVGAIIKSQNLGRLSLEPGLITPQMVLADEAGEKLLTGSVALQAIAAGVPVTRSATVQPGDRGFLAAVLPKGKRAITIAINETSGVHGLALPGDRVDVILTYSVDGVFPDGSKREIRASETVVTNLRVLALDSTLSKNKSDESLIGQADPRLATTATVEVTPRQAELISLAATLGDLSLALNSVFDGGDAPEAAAAPLEKVNLRNHAVGHVAAEAVRTITLDSDVTSLLRAPGNAKPGQGAGDRAASIQIVRGPKVEDVKRGAQVAMQPEGTSPTPETAKAQPY